MTLTLSLPSKTLGQLQAAAATQGVDTEALAVRILESSAMLSSLTYRQLLEPIHRDVAKSGMSDKDVDQLLDDAIAETRRERRANRAKA